MKIRRPKLSISRKNSDPTISVQSKSRKELDYPAIIYPKQFKKKKKLPVKHNIVITTPEEGSKQQIMRKKKKTHTEKLMTNEEVE